MPIKLLSVGYYCSIFARWRHWIKWITKIRVNMPCSAYTCLDVCKNHLLISSTFLDIWENVEWPRFFGPPCRMLLVEVCGRATHRVREASWCWEAGVWCHCGMQSAAQWAIAHLTLFARQLHSNHTRTCQHSVTSTAQQWRFITVSELAFPVLLVSYFFT